MSSDYAALGAERLETTSLSTQAARRHPISAFTLLEGGDVFERASGRPNPEARRRAEAWVREAVHLESHGAAEPLLQQVRSDLVRQLAGNLQLVARMEEARPLAIDLVPPGVPLWRHGYPRSVAPNASGLFWDVPGRWTHARIALRQERLVEDGHLVFHEFAHALWFLAFTAEERELVYRLQLPVYRSRLAVDEVFAIYSEREFIPSFRSHDTRAPGIYGHARSRWDERHAFTRFVRHLYSPDKPLPGAGFSARDSGWLG